MKRPTGAAFKAYPFIVIGRFGLGVRYRFQTQRLKTAKVLVAAALTGTAWRDPRVSAGLEFSCPGTPQSEGPRVSP